MFQKVTNYNLRSSSFFIFLTYHKYERSFLKNGIWEFWFSTPWISILSSFSNESLFLGQDLLIKTLENNQFWDWLFIPYFIPTALGFNWFILITNLFFQHIHIIWFKKSIFLSLSNRYKVWDGLNVFFPKFRLIFSSRNFRI